MIPWPSRGPGCRRLPLRALELCGWWKREKGTAGPGGALYLFKGPKRMVLFAGLFFCPIQGGHDPLLCPGTPVLPGTCKISTTPGGGCSHDYTYHRARAVETTQKGGKTKPNNLSFEVERILSVL